LVRIGFGAQFSTIPSVHWVLLIEDGSRSPRCERSGDADAVAIWIRPSVRMRTKRL